MEQFSASSGVPSGQVCLMDRNAEPAGFQLVDANRSGKRSPYDLVELATQIQTADQFTRANAMSKLSVIAEQVAFLQQQARKILQEARINQELHHIACNFKKIPGKVYYVYCKPDGRNQRFLSMISPQEWGSQCPAFVGGYRLELDMSWTPLEQADRKSQELAMIEGILTSGSPLQLTLA